MYFKMYICGGKDEFLAAIALVFSVTSFFRNHSNFLIWWRNISYYFQCWKQLLL